MIVIGLTGGIASGKTTILNFIKKQNIPVHDSVDFVRRLYENPTQNFLDYLKSIGLKNAIKKNKINKDVVREEVFTNQVKLKKLEAKIHKKVRLSRNNFIKKQVQQGKKIVVLDIPLLFENKLEKICNYIFLAHCSYRQRRSRALSRNTVNKKTRDKIFKLQTPDTIRLTKSDFVFNTSLGRAYSNLQVLKALNKIKLLNKL